MKLNKFGTISEKDGQIILGGFDIDPQGKTIYSDDHLLEMCLDLVIEELLRLKQARIDAKRLIWLAALPDEAFYHA